MEKMNDIEIKELTVKANYFDKIFSHWTANADMRTKELFDFLDKEHEFLKSAKEELIQIHNEKNDYQTYLQLKKRFEG